jgi:Flp pilus assembly pilin Flp
MPRMFNGWRRGERGASVAEMALVAGLLLLLVVGVSELGRAFHAYITITNASREGARYASRFPSLQAGIEQAVKDEVAGSGVDPAELIISYPLGLGNASGQPIAVEVTFNLPTVAGGIIGLGDLTLRSRTDMVVFGLDTP